MNELPFELAELSLLVFMALPFGYLTVKRNNSLLAHKRRGADAAFFTLSIVAAFIVVGDFLTRGIELPVQQRLMLFLHFAPLVLTIMMIVRLRELSDLSKLVRGNQVDSDTEGQDAFAPRPLNDSVETIGWDDLIIGPKLKEELESVIQLLRDPSSAAAYGIRVPKGVLLQGPPGTGKTTLAKVVANTAGLSFFALRMDEIVSKYVGESEKNLTRLFETAAKHSPSVIFVDEVESIGKARSSASQGFGDGLLNHLLQLMDGVVQIEGLYVIAATNRAELVDGALLRPGRLEKVVDVPLPNTANRGRMFDLYLSKMNLESTVDRRYLAEMTLGCSGADIKAICNQAALNAYKREGGAPAGSRTFQVSEEDLLLAVEEFVNSAQVANYS